MPPDSPRSLPHIYLPDHGAAEPYTSPRSGGGGAVPPMRDRAQHATALERALGTALAAAAAARVVPDPAVTAAGTPGFYLEFELRAAQIAVVDKLEKRGRGDQIELVAVRPLDAAGDRVTATVFVPESQRDYYLRKIDAYRTQNTPTGKPKNEPLVASIETVRLAAVRSLYTDSPDLFPSPGQLVWWEVWLRHETRPVFEQAARRLGIVLRPHSVIFPEREVMLALAPLEALGRIVAHSDTVAELRLARDNPATFMEMTPDEQIAWSEELAGRVASPAPDAPAVCLLDSGTTRRHPLIRPALALADQQAWDGATLIEDIGANWGGHCTEMSGLALYGDLVSPLTSDEPVPLTHCLESIKILPDRGQNDPDLYGHITAEAIARAEITAPARRRVVCLAVTSEGDHWCGRPSSWSAKLDDLACGEGDHSRLIVVSAGNIRVRMTPADYLDRNDLSAIESPAQAWNALTVGAFTEKTTIVQASYRDWQPLGQAGDLSPCSRTSVLCGVWPIKPDVVFEGGNLAIDPATGAGDHIDDLALLTTFRRPEERPFTTTGDTSAATALASRVVAQILADQPQLRPETVRGLIVHAAEWTPAMLTRLNAAALQQAKASLIRRYGYGVPELERALRSLQNDVTLVIQGSLQPFDHRANNVATKDLVLHDLPWPAAALDRAGAETVQMKVTLSYFIEPNPGERGWTRRHTYASHGLRFVVKRSEEGIDAFRRRINAAIHDDRTRHAASGAEDGWFLGPRLRDRGSLHSDIWTGTAADLASRHAIAVYPVGGWWREKAPLRRYERQVRYALIVSLRAPQAIDLYTPIRAAVPVPVVAAVEI
jgi:hypothetical protein